MLLFGTSLYFASGRADAALSVAQASSLRKHSPFSSFCVDRCILPLLRGQEDQSLSHPSDSRYRFKLLYLSEGRKEGSVFREG